MFLLMSVVLYAIVLHVVHALPLEKRIVIDPQITSPNAGTVWTPGETELVTWYVGSCDYLGAHGWPTRILGILQLFRPQGTSLARFFLAT